MSGNTLQKDNSYEIAFNPLEGNEALVYRYRFYYRGVRGLIRPCFDVASKYDDSLPDRYFGKVDGGTARYVQVGSEEHDTLGKAALELINREYGPQEAS